MDNKSNNHQLKRIKKEVQRINDFSNQMKSLSDEQLQFKTEEFKHRLHNGEKAKDILHEVFAVVREASHRVLGLRHYDVQLMGGLAMYNGNIAEMKTGEGKTLVGVAPSYMNFLLGKKVHIITVNEYLSQRDLESLLSLYYFLGVSVSFNHSELEESDKKDVYQADVIFGTNSEFAFDYLRDNMQVLEEDKMQSNLDFAIIDEVDSILIDEAQTPLVISSSNDENVEEYKIANQFITTLSNNDYQYDEKDKVVQLTTYGVSKAEKYFDIENLFDITNSSLLHKISQSLQAHKSMFIDIDYVIENNEIIIVDRFTGRLLEGRRFSNGLHQALEAKENLPVNHHNDTLGTITFQNYFRLYKQLSGMTGTAKTEEEEFRTIYNMDVVDIPTNRIITRVDKDDRIFKTKEGKFKSILQEIKKCYNKAQPVLIGTPDIESSEYLSFLLRKDRIPHNVLNAKQHEKEAQIISQAGQKGSITISTNMAGRGTDIQLGEGVAEMGGLAVIGTERHESRRIDNQLRGRAGRQGDSGYSIFYISLEDDLVKRFASDSFLERMENLIDDENPIESKMVSKAIEEAQRRIEGNNFDKRKRILSFDNVLAEQRNSIYQQRNRIIDSDNLIEVYQEMQSELLNHKFSTYIDKNEIIEDIDVDLLVSKIQSDFQIPKDTILLHINLEDIEEFKKSLKQFLFKSIDEKYYYFPEEARVDVLKMLLLQTLDEHWVKHLKNLEELKEGIHLRSYGQIEPLQAYKVESFSIYEKMMLSIQQESVQKLMLAEIQPIEEINA